MKFEPQYYGDLPIPFQTWWSAELAHRAPVATTVTIMGQRTRFLSEGVSDPGIGKPVFKRLHSDRHFRLWREDRCQICCQPLGLLPSYAITYGRKVDGRPLVTDGLPMHRECARVAIRACPALRARFDDGTAFLWRAANFKPLPVLIREVPAAMGGNEVVNKIVREGTRRGVLTVNGVDLAILDGQAVSPDDI